MNDALDGLQKEIKMYDGKVYGKKVSNYALEHGYLDYQTIAEIIGDCILNNTIRAETMTDWEMINGDFDRAVFQDYIISEDGYDFLSEYTDEFVFYNETLDVYIWAVTHFGTAWSHVLTNVKLVEVL